jgi:hypothetical protein
MIILVFSSQTPDISIWKSGLISIGRLFSPKETLTKPWREAIFGHQETLRINSLTTAYGTKQAYGKVSQALLCTTLVLLF